MTRRFFNRRNLRFGIITIIGIFALTALSAVFLLRWGYVDQWLAARLKTGLAEYGIRLEMGAIHASVRSLGVELRDVKLYAPNAPEPFITFDHLTADVTLHDLFGFKRKAEVRLRSLALDGLRARYTVDAQGHANLDGLHLPPKEGPIIFTYSTAEVQMRNAEFYYVDRTHKLDGTARNLTLALAPEAGDNFRLLASTQQSDFVFDGRESSGLGISLNAQVNDKGAMVDALTLTSPLMTADLKGELKDWREFKYRFDARAEVKLREIARLFAAQMKLSGATHFEGQVEGQGALYQAKGKIRGEKLIAQDVRIDSFSFSAAAKGNGAKYEVRDDLTINHLEAAGFHVNRFAATGRVFGSGVDFNWQGNLRMDEVIGQEVSASGISFDGAHAKGRATNPAGIRFDGLARVEKLITADVPVGNIVGEVMATRDEITVPSFSGEVFGGVAKGSARVRIDGLGSSEASAELSGINLDQAVAVAAGRRWPLRGTAEGRVSLAWQRGDYKSAQGTVNLKFKGNTLRPGEATTESEGIPVSGELNLIAEERHLRVERTVVQTGATRIAVSGELGRDRTGSLDVALDSNDAAELQTLALDLARSADTEAARNFVKAAQEREVQLTNKLSFNGRVTGSLNEPKVQGRLALDAVNLHDELLGKLTGDLAYDSDALRLEKAQLSQPEGGRADFTFQFPFKVENGATARVHLENFALASAVRAFASPLVKITGAVTGDADLSGLPDAMRGAGEFKIAGAKYGEQAFDEAGGRFAFNGTRVEVENVRLRSGASLLTGGGAFDTQTKGYRVNLRGEGLDVGEFVNAAREARLPLTGHANLQLEAESAKFELGETRGRIFDRASATLTSDDLNFRSTKLGHAKLTVDGRDSVAKFDLTAELLGHGYTGAGEIDFSQPEAPVKATVDLQEVALAPLLDLIAGTDIAAVGTASGQLRVMGNLLGEHDAARVEADLTQLTFDLGDYRLTAQPPINLKLNSNQVDFGAIKLSGTGTNLTLEGSIALSESGRMNLAANGDANLRILQSFVRGLFADGLVRLQAGVTGSYKQPRFSGTATLQDGVLRGAGLPVALSKAKGRLLFTADQAQLESFTADVGNGKMTVTGGAAFANLRPQRWRLQIRASDVRVDYPRDARTTFDGDLTLEGNRQFQVLGGLVNVRRAEYLADVDLFEFVDRMAAEFGTLNISAAEEESLIPPTQLDIQVAANDTLVLHTKTLDVVGSAALRLRGPVNDPAIGGRLTVSRGIVDNLFNERYRVTNGFIEFPGVDKRPPRMNIEAETEISGYRLIVLAAGPVNAMRLTPRSEPPLPQADVIALLTSGQLANETGAASSSQALAQTSVNTIASFFAQPLSRRIETNVTSRLFGLNRFSIDPLLTGRGTDPTARITVGRRVTKDLSITYSTNLASNQDQIVLIEYRASDRLSFVASRAQDGSFGFDVRLRKRF